MIRPKHKNELFKLLSQTKFGIDSFTYEDGQYLGEDAFVITFNQTPLKFYIKPSPLSYDNFKYSTTRYAPSFPVTQLMPSNQHIYANIETILVALKNWMDGAITDFASDQTELDLWDAYLGTRKSLDLTAVNFSQHEKFSSEERLQVKLAFGELKLLIREKFNTTEAQQQLVIERLDYLSDAMERLNKFDWTGTLVNIVLAIIVALSLDTEKGKILFELFKRILANIPRIGQ